MMNVHELARRTLPKAAKEIKLGQKLTPFTDLLLEYAEHDPRVCYVGVDTMDSAFRSRYPERAFDVGIAEQNQLGVATGLARTGMIPVVQAWSPFTPLRNFDQLRTSLARHNSNVKIVTTALGLANCSHGATHHDLESLALFRTVPNLVVLAPVDFDQFEQAFRAAMEHEGPVVLMGPPEIYAPGEESLDLLPQEHGPFVIGRAEWIRRGSDVCLVSFGPALRYAWTASNRLAEEGYSIGVLNMSSLKPLDGDAVGEAANATAIVSVEEQTIVGGLGSAVAEVIAENGLAVKFRRIGIPDQFVEQLGDWYETRRGVGLTVHAICEKVRAMQG